MKHTRRWLALILAIALVAANASYQLGTSLYAKEDQAAVETQSEENQKQEAVNTEEPKSTGSAQVEEVQEDQNTSDDATQAEESKNTQADAKASSSADNNAEQNQADTAQANENAVAAATVTASDVAPTLAANTDGSVSGSGYDSIKLVVNTDGITNQNNTKFNIKFDTGNTENNKKISASNLNPSEGLASNLMKNRGGTYDVNGFNKNAFTITVTKGADCKNSIKTEATVDVASGTVTLNISDYYESSYNDKTFTNPTATSLGSVNDFAVFAKNYKNSNDMEGNIAVQNWTVGSHTMGMTGNIKDGHDYDISYVENIVGGLNKDEAFRSGNPLIIGDAYTPGTQDSNFTLTVNGVTKKIGNVTDVVNIKNSSYKIDFDTAMAGVRQYASAMYGKSDTKGVTFKNPNGNTTTKSDNVQTIQCKPNINNIINIKASDLKKWADNVQITGLGDTGSVTFNIKYDVAQQFTKPYFTINGTETGGYDVTGGRILLNFGTQQGALSFGELYSGTILAPNATVYISTTHNGSVFADTVENIGGEIHKNPWKPGNEQKPTSVKVTLKGTKTLNGTSAQKDAFSFLLQQTDENGTVLENGYQQNVKNGENGQISFDEITYTTPGTYYYKISEVSGSDVNIRYDASVYKVVVTVDENMTATVAYYKDGNLVNSDTGAAFSNTSIVREVKASLQGNKTLNGQPSTAAYKYQVVEVADEKGTVKDNAQSWEVTNNTTETAAIEFPEFTYNAAGDYYYKVTEVNANADGMEYDPSVYIAHVSVAAQNDGSLTASVTYRKYASADQMNPESAANADKITFANKTLKAQVTFTGNKTVNGFEAKDKFSFKVVEKDKDGKATVTDTKKTDANNTVSDTKDITFNNQTITYSDAKIQLTATKNLAGSPSEKEFDFKMEECDENGNVTAGTKVVTASNDKSGLITFDELTYKDAGTHYYKISEAAPENPEANIVYDNAAYIVKVDVTKDDTAAALTATASEYKKLVTGADGQTTTENVESVVFNNGIKVSTSFTGQKYVDGELASTAGAFSFTLTRTDDTYANALTGEDAYSETVSNDAAGNITFTEINYDTPGDYYYTISENVPEQQEANMYYDEAVYRAKVTVSKDGQVTVEKSVVPYDGYEGDDGNTFESVEDDEFLIFNNYHFMTMSMDYALATITGTKTLKGGNLEAGEFRFGLYDSNGTLIDTKTNDASGKITFRTIPYYTAGTYSYTVKEINEQGENNVSDIEYDPSVYTVTVNVDENMDTSITYIKHGTNVNNSSESVDGISFENKMSVTAAAIDPAVKKVLNNAELQPGEFTFQLFDENNNLIDTKKNTDNGSVLFDSIIFDEVGDYNYTIKELIPSDPGQITYDDREIKVNVSVTKDDTTGNLEATITYLEDNAPTEEPTFVNTYNPISIRVQKTSKDGSKDPLKGATYALYKVLSGEGRDILIGTQISDENGYMTFENVEPGTYYFKEVSAPAGHTVDEYATKKFTVSADGTINQLTAKRSSRSTQAVMFSLDSLTAEDAQISALEADDNKDAIVLAEAPGVSDEVTKLSVSKLDYTNHEFVTGAKMQILEKSSGKIVAEWTTGDSAESFERKLNVDTSYILREVSAPEGYDLAEDTEFIIDAYGILSIISGPDAEKTSDTALRIYDKKLGVTKVTKNTKENHNQKFVDVVKTVKTGDTAQIGLFAILSIAAIVVVIIVLRRRKNL